MAEHRVDCGDGLTLVLTDETELAFTGVWLVDSPQEGPFDPNAEHAIVVAGADNIETELEGLIVGAQKMLAHVRAGRALN